MKKYLLVLLCVVAIACGTANGPTLQVEKEKRLVLIQRNSTTIEGDKEAIEIRIGDITGGQTDVEVTGMSSHKSYLHEYMASSDKAVIDYYGSLYLVEITHFENHLLHDDKAELLVKPVTKEEAASIRKRNNERETKPVPMPEEDTFLYKHT